MQPSAFNVQADAQFTVARILKPFADFEDQYQGESPHIPIAFFPEDMNDPNHGVMTTDPSAGDTGYADNLLRFVPVPFGSRICVWIPYAVGYDAENEAYTAQQYVYVFQWRIRNLLHSHRTVRAGEMEPHHIQTIWGRQNREDANNPEQRYFIPSSRRTVVVAQGEAQGNLPQLNNLRTERIENITDDTRQQLPYLPNGEVGYYQQGVFDPAEYTGLASPLDETPWRSIYRPFWFDCEGDELMITALRDDAYDQGGGTWDFAAGGDDMAFSAVYGRNNAGSTIEPSRPLGILLFTGSNP